SLKAPVSLPPASKPPAPSPRVLPPSPVGEKALPSDNPPVLPLASSPIVASPPIAQPRSPASSPPSAQRTPNKARLSEKPQPEPSQESIELAAEKAVQETGFDPRTGQILDPAKFQKWRQQKAASHGASSSSTNSSL